MISSRKQLAVALSRLKSFEKPSWKLEQYSTDSEIASEIIWHAFLNNDIKNKVIADLGCGSGIFGIGALLFNPKKVYFVDIDESPLKQLRESLMLFGLKNYEIICSDVSLFNKKVDVVFQNPPFGVKKKHADRQFLKKAFEIAKVVYTFHKLNTEPFIRSFSEENNFKASHFFKFDFPLKKSQAYHDKERHFIKVGCWRLVKQRKYNFSGRKKSG